MLPTTHSETHITISICTPEKAYPRFHDAILSTKYFDDETELAYYGYRYYSPELGRWSNRDPLLDESALRRYLTRRPFYEHLRLRAELTKLPAYRFVNNDPVGYLDDLGLMLVGPGPGGLVGPLPGKPAPKPAPPPSPERYVGIRCVCRCGRVGNDPYQARAEGDSAANGPPPPYPDYDRSSALQHCVASAWLATLQGCDCAECIGSKREDWQERYSGQDPRYTEAAKDNNRLGRDIVGCWGPDKRLNPGWLPSMPIQTIIQKCKDAIDNGKANLPSQNQAQITPAVPVAPVQIIPVNTPQPDRKPKGA